LDDSTYRDYSRLELSRARQQATVATQLCGSFDTVISIVLFIAVLCIVLRHIGVIETSW
jgi:hypothetical protein